MSTTVIDHKAIEHEPLAQLREAILSHTARVAVMGMGYVGLPMAISFARVGFHVTGIDASLERCEALTHGHSHVEAISNELLNEVKESGRFSVTSSFASLAYADVVLICVPTPLSKSKDPDLTAVLEASRAVAQHLHKNQLIILESTTYPGTTEEILLPMFQAEGFVAGEDFCLAFSPERIDPGSAHFTVENITKLVGACSPVGTEIAGLLYEQVIERVVPVSSPRVAEAAKLLENTFRSVNIALANEMAIVCRHLGVDVWEVIDAAATKPFGFMAHYPGPGIGGHCIPLDPHYLAWKARLSGYEPRFIMLASQINGDMPRHVVDMISMGLNDMCKPVKGSKVLLLGVSYKPNVGDVRESPALEVLELLDQRGASLSYSDPYIPTVAVGDGVLASIELTPEKVREFDCVAVITNHRAFDYEMIAREATLVIDTRNAMRLHADTANVRFL